MNYDSIQLMTVPLPLRARELAAGIDDQRIRQLVVHFYGIARQDPILEPIFTAHIADADWPHHVERITDFWSNILLATGRYRGNPLLRHLALEGLGPQHFARWLELFEQATQEILPEVAEALHGLATRMAEGMQRTLKMARQSSTQR